jgi:hypothetical protein
MRRLFLIAAFLTLPWMYGASATVVLGAPAIAVAAEPAPEPPAAPKIDVDVQRTEKHVISFANPTVLAIAGGAVLLLVVIAMMSRGGGTTIVKEK